METIKYTMLNLLVLQDGNNVQKTARIYFERGRFFSGICLCYLPIGMFFA